jgi:hypothetical protein
MDRTRWITLAAVILLVAGAAWYFASPAYTLSRMKAAAESNDPDAMSAYIDYPTLRDDMKSDLMEQIMAQAEKDTSGFGALGMALGTAMIGPMIDGMVSPAGMKAAFSANGNKVAGAQRAKTPKALQMKEDMLIKRRGLSEFVVTSKSEPDGGMIFKRHGLGWKLSGVDLPPAKPSGVGEPIDVQ